MKKKPEKFTSPGEGRDFRPLRYILWGMAETPRKNANERDIKALLLRAGMRPTAQRLALCGYVLREARHLTVQDLKEWKKAHFPKISVATLYNTLNALVEAGLVRSLKLPETEMVIYDTNVSDHYHFLDESTGELFDLDRDQVRISPRLTTGYSVTGIDVVIRGTRHK